jgi:hypothetical protein
VSTLSDDETPLGRLTLLTLSRRDSFNSTSAKSRTLAARELSPVARKRSESGRSAVSPARPARTST